MERTLEMVRKWWERIQYETPPFAWRDDPRLEGITEAEFNWLRSLDEAPTYLYQELNSTH